MKKVIGFLSVSLWSAALLFSPAPADAFLALYSTNSVAYFSCSTYQTISQVQCQYSNGEEYVTQYYYGKMKNTIPLSACAGACNGSLSLFVVSNPGNGRKSRTYADDYQCAGSYQMDLTPCNNCT